MSSTREAAFRRQWQVAGWTESIGFVLFGPRLSVCTMGGIRFFDAVIRCARLVTADIGLEAGALVCPSEADCRALCESESADA